MQEICRFLDLFYYLEIIALGFAALLSLRTQIVTLADGSSL